MRSRAVRLLAFVSLALILSFGALAQGPRQVDVWVPIGPFGALVYTLASSPGNPGVVFAGTTGGLFRSGPGLAAWEPVEITGTMEPGVRSLWIDPRDPDTIVAGTDELLFHSTDGGESWERSDVELPVPIGEKPICLVEDPSAPGTLYACSGSTYFVFDFGQGVLKSTDGGASFRQASSQLGAANVTSLLVVPGSPTLLYAAVPTTWGEGAQASPTGVLVSADGGATWTTRNAGLVLPAGQPGVSQLARDPRTGTLFALVASTGAVFASHDGAASWTLVATPAPAGAIAFAQDGALYMSSTPASGGRIFGSDNGETGWSETHAPAPASLLSPQPELPGVFAAARLGLVVSRDRGATWRLSRRGLGDRPGRPLDVDRSDGTLYALWGERLYRRLDGVWRALSGFVHQLETDPDDPGQLLAVRLATLQRSRNGGITWRNVRLPDACVEIQTVAYAPSDPRVVYTGGSAPEGSGPGHHPPPDASCLAQCQSWRSDDGGETWSCLPLDGVSRFVVDPRRASTVYAIHPFSNAFPNLLYFAKSVDGGRTWRKASEGLNQLGGFVSPNLLTIDPTDSSRLFTFVDLTPGQHLFMSENGGASWAPRGRPLPPEASSAISLLLARSRPDVFYVGTSLGGILRSANGGNTWRQLAPGLPPAQFDGTLIADPTQRLVFYAGTRQRGVAELRRSRP
ncbi:MAG TPA: hypothetical protein VF756_30640 [Thermoanaerobaculia bacterium]